MNRRYGFFILLLTLLISLMVACVAPRQIDSSRINTITCRLTFYSTAREDADRIRRVLDRYRIPDFSLFLEVFNDSIYTEFTVAELDDLNRIHSDLKDIPRMRRSLDGGDDPGRQLRFAEFEPEFAAIYKAVLLEGGLQMTLRFHITPGARLYYAPERGWEQEVDEIYIDEKGDVRMPVAVSQGQDYVYGRTVLGDVVRCIRIHVYTGDTEQISLEQYRSRVRTEW